MKKQLGIFTTLLFMCTAMCLWAVGGEGQYFNGPAPSCCAPQPARPCCPAPRPVCQPAPVCAPVCQPKPVCAPTCAPTCAPVCQPKPVCAPVCQPRPCCPPPCAPEPECVECKQPVRCRYPHSNELVCRDGITVKARNPGLCMLGDQYPLEFDVCACDDVCDVVVTTHLPEGVTFLKSNPEADVQGRKLVWNIGSMSKGQVIHARVFLRCECEGDLCTCFCATASPVRFCSLLCAKPILSCSKCGPQEFCPGDPVNFNITVSNHGSCAAEDVVVTDQVPDGLEHQSGQRTLCFRLGTLEPCQTKKINVCFTATKRGRICNTIVVTACNADPVSCQWCCDCCKECIELNKVGPKEQQIGKNADYQITVFNPGDKPLTEVVVTDNAPANTSIVAANGAAVNGNQAVWRLRELRPGEKVNFNLTLTTCTPGCFTNRVHVTNCQNCTACAEFTTRWRGRPALTVQICDTEDPICVGEMTSYCISVVNQGSEADNNVAVTVRFPNEIQPISATGDTPGQVCGQTVTFAPYNNFRPRQTLSYRIDARARESGDARVIVEVSSDSIRTPIEQQESTIVN